MIFTHKVLFILLPFPSHYFACFPYAKTLQREGYQIIFAGSINQRKIVENEGFLFCDIRYMIEYSISSFKVFIALFIQSLLNKAALFKRYREWYNGVQTINQVLQIIKPVKVYLDDHLCHYYPIVIKKCQQVELVNTKLSTKKTVGVPPLDSSFIPNHNIISTVICEILWFNHLIHLRLSEKLSKVALLSRDEDYFVERIAKKDGINFKALIDSSTSFYKGLHNINVLILAPPSLEFPSRSLNLYERYVNIPIERNEEYLINKRYLNIIAKVIFLKRIGMKLIYCSFGTLSVSNAKKVIGFAHRLFSVLENESQWQLIFSTGGIEFDKVPTNVFLFNQVPQLDLLRNCDMMITHGGLTSIKECIQQNVPMLVYPINRKFDQNGNAARVYFHNLGLRGNISSDSSENIRKKIYNILYK